MSFVYNLTTPQLGQLATSIGVDLFDLSSGDLREIDGAAPLGRRKSLLRWIESQKS